MKKLEKKQVPQFIALCILSSGVFGYFVVRLVTPTPAAAGTRPRPVQEAAKPGAVAAAPSAKKAGAVTDTASPTDAAPIPAPTAGMRDPFVVGYVDPKLVPAGAPAAPALPAPAKAAHTQMASIHEMGPAPVSAPFVPGLPLGLKSFPPAAPSSLASAGLPSAPHAPALPQAPAAPTWTVTGVLQNDAQQVAILRNGEARRFVRTGDFVDSQFKVVDVTRSSVTLRHGAAVYHLLLGGVKPATAPAKSPASLPVLTMPAAKPQSAAAQAASLNRSLTAIYESGLTLAQSFFTAIGSRPAHPAPADQVAMLFPEESPFALDPNTAWPQARSLNTSDADQAAETLLSHNL